MLYAPPLLLSKAPCHAGRPPELLLASEEAYTSAVDIWGAACIFCKLLTGKLPFMGKAGSGVEQGLADQCFRGETQKLMQCGGRRLQGLAGAGVERHMDPSAWCRVQNSSMLELCIDASLPEFDSSQRLPHIRL